MKRIIWLAYLFVVLVSAGFCGRVSPGDVQKVAGVHAKLGYIQNIRAGALSAAEYSVKEIRTITDQDTGEDLAYIILLEPRGFIAVSPDDQITPVIAYSFENDFSFQDSYNNVLLYMLKKDMDLRLEALPLTSAELKENNRGLWNSYLSEADYINDLQSSSQWPDGDNTGWLDTSWHQTAPYNSMCPIDPVTSQRSVVGCVATAIAQIVNFHRYPLSISLDSGDSYTTTTRGILVNSFDEVNSELSDIDYSDYSQGYAPALSFACGVIVEMDYTSIASGAWFHDYDFTDDLGYKDAVELQGSGSTFYSNLIKDMKNRRPAIIAIRNAGGEGHAIVVDGYRDTGVYHLNYGWGSSSPDPISTCWYSLPAGMPAGFVLVEYGVLRITAPNLNPYNTSEDPASYPNPFRLGSVSKVKIAMPAAPDGYIDKVRIYTPAGDMVREIAGGDLYVEWDGKNSAGNKCAPGLYFYSMRTTEKENLRGKITVLP